MPPLCWDRRYNQCKIKTVTHFVCKLYCSNQQKLSQKYSNHKDETIDITVSTHMNNDLHSPLRHTITTHENQGWIKWVTKVTHPIPWGTHHSWGEYQDNSGTGVDHSLMASTEVIVIEAAYCGLSPLGLSSHWRKINHYVWAILWCVSLTLKKNQSTLTLGWE